MNTKPDIVERLIKLGALFARGNHLPPWDEQDLPKKTPKLVIRLLSSAADDAKYHARLIKEAADEIKRLRAGGWQDIDVNNHSFKHGEEFLAILKSSRGSIKRVILEYRKVDDATWFIDGYEISNNWDPIMYMLIPSPPDAK